VKYVIVSGRQKNGGSVVLHKLYEKLGEFGEEAEIFYVGPLKYYKLSNIVNFLKDILYYVCFGISAAVTFCKPFGG